MRISDWSSYVCASDLKQHVVNERFQAGKILKVGFHHIAQFLNGTLRRKINFCPVDQRGQRGAQFMRYVSVEPLHLLISSLDTCQHFVERVREFSQFTIDPTLWQPHL